MAEQDIINIFSIINITGCRVVDMTPINYKVFELVKSSFLQIIDQLGQCVQVGSWVVSGTVRAGELIPLLRQRSPMG